MDASSEKAHLAFQKLKAFMRSEAKEVVSYGKKDLNSRERSF
jgi:hypothetical protein